MARQIHAAHERAEIPTRFELLTIGRAHDQCAPPKGDLERWVLVFAGQGLLDKQISDRMGITESTVRNHWQHIFSQLSVSNRTEAVTKALRQGLI